MRPPGFCHGRLLTSQKTEIREPPPPRQQEPPGARVGTLPHAPWAMNPHVPPVKTASAGLWPHTTEPTPGGGVQRENQTLPPPVMQGQ